MTHPTPRHIFVYGTLRQAYSRLPLSVRHLRPPQLLQTSNEWIGIAKLHKYVLYDVGEYPGVVRAENVPRNDEKSSITSDQAVVLGDVYTVEDKDMPTLDEYEGITDYFTKPQEYSRVIVDVVLQNESSDAVTLPVWLYEYRWPIQKSAVCIPGGDYVEYSASLVVNGRRSEATGQ